MLIMDLNKTNLKKKKCWFYLSQDSTKFFFPIPGPGDRESPKSVWGQIVIILQSLETQYFLEKS